MPRPVVTTLLVGLSLLLATPASAERLGKGRSLVLIGVGGHVGQFVLPGFPIALRSDEVGGYVAYSRFLSDQWTVSISGGYHVGQTKIEENNPNGTPFSIETLDTRSFTIRVGGDRWAFIDDAVAVYAGPGLFLARGRAKAETKVIPPATGGGSSTGSNTTEVGFNGHIGMYARFGKGTALFGHIGQVLSHASGEDPNGKVSWWSSTPEGSVGLAFDF